MTRLAETPEGLFIYNRETGYAAYVPSIKSRTWSKPLYVQIAVTEKCNMSCPFCYLSSSPRKTRVWPTSELVELVEFLDSWGVLGVAYGGGEPFMHPDLVEIVKWTWVKTGLDVSVTTNGTVASERQLEEIEGYVGEVRVSIRNLETCKVLEKFIGRKFDLGVNLLLTRENITQTEEIVRECVEIGIKDFLVNSFLAVGRGEQHKEWEPKEEDFDRLAILIEKFRDEATFKVSGRTAVNLKNCKKFRLIPFENEGRGRVIAVTVEKRVKPSSLIGEAYQFSKPSEIPSIYKRYIVGGEH